MNLAVTCKKDQGGEPWQVPLTCLILQVFTGAYEVLGARELKVNKQTF